MKFFDAHTHIHFPAYDLDREEVFSRAQSAGVRMITVGTQFSTSASAVEFARLHKGDAWATVGFHPAHFSEKWYHDKNEQAAAGRQEFDIKELRKLAENPEVVAIGECGLDYFRDASPKTKNGQREAFMAQMKLAREVKKPLMIHCRAAFGDLIEMLHASRQMLQDCPGAIHFFSGTAEDAKKILELGFSFTFGGVVTFSRDYDEVIKYVPLDRILSETDAPYVAPVPYRGKRNEPAYVVEVVKKLAEIKRVSVEEMTGKILTNARSVFRIRI